MTHIPGLISVFNSISRNAVNRRRPTRFLLLTQFFMLVAMLLFSQMALAATTATADIDRNPVMQDEGFNLIIKVDDDVDRNAFDPSVLNKDFVVNRTNVSSQTQIINFKRSQTTTWKTSLIPRDVGRFTIPAFDIAGATTQPITVEVLPVSQNKNAQGNPLFITTELQQTEAWLQQQVQYTVKLHIALDLQRGSLSAPEMRGGEITQVGEDKETSEVIDGRRYRIIERTFSIIPQESGEFVVQAPRFEGEVLDASRRNFGFFNQTRTITKVGKNQTLRVNPIPENYPYPWLPSEHVEIHDEWQGIDDNNGLIVGEPVTRTVILTALGVVESQLSEITSDYPDSLKIYPDQAETTAVERNGTFVAQRQESLAIIANQIGAVTIPEIQVPWFNVLTEKTEFVTLPARTLQVNPAPDNNSNSAPPPVLTPTPAQPSVTAPAASIVAQPHWWSLSSWVLLGLWLLTLIAWWWTNNTSRSETSHSTEHSDTSKNEAALWAELQRALKREDDQNLTNYLQPWLAEICGDPQQSLNRSVEQLQNPQLQQLLTQWFSRRFSAQQSTGTQAKGKLLQQLNATLKDIRTQTKQRGPASGVRLQPLYPQ